MTFRARWLAFLRWWQGTTCPDCGQPADDVCFSCTIDHLSPEAP